MDTTLVGLITGALAGFIASKLQSGASKGLLVNLFLGIIGGVIGSWLFALLGIEAHGFIGSLVCAVVGALILLWFVSKIK